MFRQLFNFGYQRSNVQAVGFYLFYMVTGIIVVTLALVGIALIITSMDANELFLYLGFQVGAWLATVVAGVLALLVLRARRLFKDPASVALALLAVPCTMFGGLMVGLPFVAFLTTRPTPGEPSVIDAEARPLAPSAT